MPAVSMSLIVLNGLGERHRQVKIALGVSLFEQGNFDSYAVRARRRRSGRVALGVSRVMKGCGNGDDRKSHRQRSATA